MLDDMALGLFKIILPNEYLYSDENEDILKPENAWDLICYNEIKD